MISDPTLRDIQRLLDDPAHTEADKLKAKAYLLEYLTQHPGSADAWYLVAALSNTPEDARLALKKSLDIDPAHYAAQRALEMLNAGVPAADVAQEPLPVQPPIQGSSPSQRKASAPQVTAPEPVRPTESQKPEIIESRGESTTQTIRNLLNTDASREHALGKAVHFYITRGWTIDDATNQQVRLVKSFGLPWVWAILLAVFLPVLGLTILIANFFVRQTKVIVLKASPNSDRISISGSIQPKSFTPADIQQERLPNPSASYGTVILVIALGLIGTCGALIAFTIMIGDVDEEETFSTGDAVYIQEFGDEPCVPFYTIPGQFSTRRGSFSQGLRVTVLDSEPTGGNVWYHVQTSEGRRGWVSGVYLDTASPDRSETLETCD